MFYDGKIYKVKRADDGLRAALGRFIEQAIQGIDDPLERYDAAKEASTSLRAVRWLVKHLAPDFKGEVTEENRAQLLKGIQRFQTDTALAAAVDTRDQRKWEAANVANP